jgi:hypothetical protein
MIKNENKHSQDNKHRLAVALTNLKESGVEDISFFGTSGEDLDYIEDALDVLKKNQAWLDENAKKKAAKYK